MTAVLAKSCIDWDTCFVLIMNAMIIIVTAQQHGTLGPLGPCKSLQYLCDLYI